MRCDHALCEKGWSAVGPNYAKLSLNHRTAMPNVAIERTLGSSPAPCVRLLWSEAPVPAPLPNAGEMRHLRCYALMPREL
jgi:hypothetical protein